MKCAAPTPAIKVQKSTKEETDAFPLSEFYSLLHLPWRRVSDGKHAIVHKNLSIQLDHMARMSSCQQTQATLSKT
jgi:hypothetical protein